MAAQGPGKVILHGKNDSINHAIIQLKEIRNPATVTELELSNYDLNLINDAFIETLHTLSNLKVLKLGDNHLTLRSLFLLLKDFQSSVTHLDLEGKQGTNNFKQEATNEDIAFVLHTSLISLNMGPNISSQLNRKFQLAIAHNIQTLGGIPLLPIGQKGWGGLPNGKPYPSDIEAINSGRALRQSPSLGQGRVLMLSGGPARQLSSDADKENIQVTTQHPSAKKKHPGRML